MSAIAPPTASLLERRLDAACAARAAAVDIDVVAAAWDP